MENERNEKDRKETVVEEVINEYFHNRIVDKLRKDSHEVFDEYKRRVYMINFPNFEIMKNYFTKMGFTCSKDGLLIEDFKSVALKLDKPLKLVIAEHTEDGRHKLYDATFTGRESTIKYFEKSN